MNTDKPIIGITGPDRGGTAAWIFTKFAVWLQGGRPIRLRPSKPEAKKELDGLVLGGGADINPGRYGKSWTVPSLGKRPKPAGIYQWIIRIASFLLYPMIFLFRKLFAAKSSAIDSNRDELEFELLEEALQKGIPVLGICRGAQLINVQFGGDLHREIKNFYGEVPQIHSIWPKKRVDLKEGSKLAEMIQAKTIWVNALHHQAVNRKGEMLRVVATEQNGLPQAIEHADYPFMIGVQWHPEYMPQIPGQRNIFKAFVEQAKSYASSATAKMQEF